MELWATSLLSVWQRSSNPLAAKVERLQARRTSTRRRTNGRIERGAGSCLGRVARTLSEVRRQMIQRRLKVKILGSHKVKPQDANVVMCDANLQLPMAKVYWGSKMSISKNNYIFEVQFGYVLAKSLRHVSTILLESSSNWKRSTWALGKNSNDSPEELDEHKQQHWTSHQEPSMYTI